MNGQLKSLIDCVNLLISLTLPLLPIIPLLPACTCTCIITVLPVLHVPTVLPSSVTYCHKISNVIN